MKKTIPLILILLSMAFWGCQEKTSKTTTTSTTGSSSSTSTTSPTTPTTTTTTTPTATATLRAPYESSAFVAHGYPPTTVIWSTVNDGIPSSTMVTDSRFHVRIKMQNSPPQTTIDKFGVECHYVSFPYTKLRGKVRVRSHGSSSYKEIAYETNATTGLSDVLKFSDLADFPQTSTYYVIEVVDPIQSDGGCVRDPSNTIVCPYYTIPHTECYSMIVQWATDYTDAF